MYGEVRAADLQKASLLCNRLLPKMSECDLLLIVLAGLQTELVVSTLKKKTLSSPLEHPPLHAARLVL